MHNEMGLSDNEYYFAIWVLTRLAFFPDIDAVAGQNLVVTGFHKITFSHNSSSIKGQNCQWRHRFCICFYFISCIYFQLKANAPKWKNKLPASAVLCFGCFCTVPKAFQILAQNLLTCDIWMINLACNFLSRADVMEMKSELLFLEERNLWHEPKLSVGITDKKQLVSSLVAESYFQWWQPVFKL